MVLLQRKLYFLKDRGCPTFLGGGGPGSRVQVLISIENHITCDFPWGGGGRGPDPLSPPLDPHMVSSPDNSISLHVYYSMSFFC